MKFEQLMKELHLSKQQNEEVIKIIQNYSEQQNVDAHRYNYESEMEKVDKEFRNPQNAELAFKYFKEKEKNSKVTLMFDKLYGDMPKYKY